ncbi:MAG: hypothetical protein J5525_12900 [Lachnospiraceae bacterium]|nr:hypothetical protein [Lachnospiraceae bacterium]
MKKNRLKTTIMSLIITLSFLCSSMGVYASSITVNMADATVGEYYEQSTTLDFVGDVSLDGGIENGDGLEVTSYEKSVTIKGTPTTATDSATLRVYDSGDDNYADLKFAIKPPVPKTSAVVNTAAVNSPAETTHIHSYEWETVKEPTEDSDGEMAYVCKCGAVIYSMPLTGQSAFIINSANKILNAGPGATINISTTHWISFNTVIRDAIKMRPDVTIVVDFLSEGHKGEPLSFTIPAGYNVDVFFNEEGWAGFCFIREYLLKHVNQ